MDDPSPLPNSEKNSSRLWRIVAGIVVFAILMACSREVSTAWARAAVAASAFIVLTLAVLSGRKAQP